MSKKSSKKDKKIIEYCYNCFKRIDEGKAISESGHHFCSEKCIDEWLMSEQSYYDPS